MKKGQDVKQMLQRINDDVQYKKDYIVPLSSLALGAVPASGRATVGLLTGTPLQQ